jgi:hypothetical protein
MNFRIRSWSAASLKSIQRWKHSLIFRRSPRTSSGAASMNPFMRSALMRRSAKSAATSSYLKTNHWFRGGWKKTGRCSRSQRRSGKGSSSFSGTSR